MYAHEQKITSKSHGDGLNVGNAGHKFLETFLKAIKDGKTDKEAEGLACNAAALMPGAAKALSLCLPWARDVWPTLGWKIVAVEVEYRITISETLVYPFKVDLIIEDMDGNLVLVDHKFLGDPYSPLVISLLPQLPKYALCLRQVGIDIKYGIYNMFRTRDTSKDLLTRVADRFNDHRMKEAMKEQIENMKRIEQQNYKPVRTANKMNCTYCQFNNLCAAEARGENTDLMRSAFFVPNTYGYTDSI